MIVDEMRFDKDAVKSQTTGMLDPPTLVGDIAYPIIVVGVSVKVEKPGHYPKN